MGDDSVDATAMACACLQPPAHSQKIGTRADEQGVEREVWQHVYEPSHPFSGMTWSIVKGKLYAVVGSEYEFYGVLAQRQRQERWQKIRRRQRRAQQRKRHRK